MRALIIDNEAKKKIAEVVKYATQYPHTLERLKKILAEDATTAGDNSNYVTTIPHGFKVVFSIEEQRIGWCKHLSVSVDEPGRLPHPAAMELIMGEFGMGNSLTNCISTWVEEEAGAVNVVTKVEDK